MYRVLIVLVMFGLLSGCATIQESTRYQPITSVAGGYSEYHLSDDIWQVYYVANQQWRRVKQEEAAERLWDYIRIRAAQLAIREGYEYFTTLHFSSIHERSIDATFDERVVKPGSGMPVTVHVLTVRLTNIPMDTESDRTYGARALLYTMKNFDNVPF